jgi:hypothetical protein
MVSFSSAPPPFQIEHAKATTTPLVTSCPSLATGAPSTSLDLATGEPHPPMRFFFNWPAPQPSLSLSPRALGPPSTATATSKHRRADLSPLPRCRHPSLVGCCAYLVARCACHSPLMLKPPAPLHHITWLADSNRAVVTTPGAMATRAEFNRGSNAGP